MIFITVGTTPFPFFRMNQVFEYLLTTRRDNEEIIYQYRATAVETKVKNILLSPSFSFNKIQEYIKIARIVVCHGGPATIYQCLYAGKKPFVLPREKLFGEHVNDHQLLFCEYLQRRHLINLLNLQNLQFKESTSFKSLSSFHSTREKLTQYLEEILEK